MENQKKKAGWIQTKQSQSGKSFKSLSLDAGELGEVVEKGGETYLKLSGSPAYNAYEKDGKTTHYINLYVNESVSLSVPTPNTSNSSESWD